MSQQAVCSRGEHARDVHKGQGPKRATTAAWTLSGGSVPPLRKKFASRTTLCAELAAGVGPCLRQPLNRREAWNKRVAGAAPLQGHHGSGQTRRCVRVILRAARSYRALDSPPTCPRSRSSRSAIAGVVVRVQLRKAKAVPVHPQADDPQDPSRWLQLAHKAVRYALCLRASECASTAQRFHERRRMAARRRVSVTIRTCCRLSRCCQLLRAARNARGCMGSRVFWAPSRDFLAQTIS